MKLSSTYYDVLLKRDPIMIDFVRKDIAEIKEGSGPFGSSDDYSRYFEDYLADVIERITDDMKLRLYSMGITDSIEAENYIRQFHSSSEFKKLLYAKHSDYLTLTNFELFGKKTFHVSSNLVEHLAHTNLEVDSELLRLPFDSCLFVFGAKTAVNAFHAFEDDGSFVDINTPISVFAHSLPAEEGERKILFACWHANHKRSYSFVKRELLIRKSWNIDQTLKTDWDDIYSETGEPDVVTINEVIFGKKGEDKVFYEKGLMFFRILINTILYLSSSQPDLIGKLSPHDDLNAKLFSLKSKAKIKKVKKQIAETSQLDYMEVGENLPPIVVDKNQVSKTRGKSVNPTISGKRFIVRGHWRNQVCGENQLERKLTWIKPYYKGPEMAELVNKQYVVK